MLVKIRRIVSLLQNYCVIKTPRGKITLCSVGPLIAVLPLIIYAYSILVIVTERTESYERSHVLHDLETLEQRLHKIFDIHSLQCRDYAQWDEAYRQAIERDPAWIKSDIIEGIAAPAFGYEIVLMQAANGDIVYQKGLNEHITKDLAKYRLLESCIKGRKTAGLALLGNELYICAARPIVKSDGSGRPRGMFLVAMLVDNELLEELAPGSKHRLAAYTAKGKLTSHQALGPMDHIPEPLAVALYSSRIPQRRQVYTSTDSLLSYGVLPHKDISGRLVAAFIDVKPRTQLAENLQIIRRTAILLMLVCGLAALMSVGYLRNKMMAIRANRDELTGLYNHGYLQEYLKNQMQVAERYGRPLSVIMLDLDHFKFINDAHGHSVGDVALKTVAQKLSETVRATDILARYGGEEFVVVCPETDLTQAVAAAERLRKAIEDTPVQFKKNKAKDSSTTAYLNITISAGVACYPADGNSSPELLEAADTALKEAKRTRNTVVSYSEIAHHMHTTVPNTIEAFLRDSSISTIRPLIAAIEKRDPHTVRHGEKTAEYAVAIAREMGFSTYDIALICKASLLHDVGMISVPDHILMKPDSLTEDEMEIIKQHPKVGAEILSQSPQLAQIANIVLYHHERWDGQGYPNGLEGEEIPIMARVVNVAGSIDSMTSPRSYRTPLSLPEARDELRAQAGKQFDPEVVEAACRVINSILEEASRKSAA